MRTLIHVPILHSEVDLGSLAEELRRRFQESFGASAWSKRVASVDSMWNSLRTTLLELPIPWEKTRLYQDGLPVCDRERDIVQVLASKGSQNHRLLLELMERGATLMGTESPELLVKEYRRGQQLVEAARQSPSETDVRNFKNEGEALLRERDRFIARRIGSTLRDDETGLLFLGLLHRVDDFLDPNIAFRHLIHHLPRREAS
ncbi:hypothetical protein [Hyalangium gracile]|uniref:hypothetical protein n=1 Tax=Hyalangium gracile TaxID=394092 RepID=UPI001CCB1B7F|nr:hypothetical protein [Hyalangium gracile]